MTGMMNNNTGSRITTGVEAVPGKIGRNTFAMSTTYQIPTTVSSEACWRRGLAWRSHKTPITRITSHAMNRPGKASIRPTYGTVMPTRAAAS
jgi:hypothetical protein